MIVRMNPKPFAGFHHTVNFTRYVLVLCCGRHCSLFMPQLAISTYQVFLRLLSTLRRRRKSMLRNGPQRIECSTIGSFGTERIRSRDHGETQANGCDKQRDSTRKGWPQLSVMELYTPVLPCVHRLEVEDPLHRYGTYLREYYSDWVASNSAQPFFTWLDCGAGRLLDASGKRKAVSRVQLNNSRVQYCNLQERQQYMVIVRDGILVWANGLTWSKYGKHEAVHTVDTTKRWIFVIDLQGNCYLNMKQKGRFHHSSFLSGAPVQMAGRMKVDHGKIVEIGEYSGHYRSSVSHLRRSVEAFFGDAIESDDDAFT